MVILYATVERGCKLTVKICIFCLCSELNKLLIHVLSNVL